MTKRRSSVPPSPYYAAILKAFEYVGPMTIKEIARYLDVQFQMVSHHLRVMRSEGKPIYKVDWELKEIKGRRSPIYGLGTKDICDDVPEPPPISRQEQKRRHYEKHKLRINLKAYKERSEINRINNPFGLTAYTVNTDSNTESQL
jgi:DNA-binding Lrp family transcriptional regulator